MLSNHVNMRFQTNESDIFYKSTNQIRDEQVIILPITNNVRLKQKPESTG